MVPPSTRLSGGSSAMASRMRLATSGSSSRRSWRLRRRAACWVSKQRLSGGDFLERAAEGEEVARAGGAEGDFGEQAFEIENGGELLAQFGAQDGLLAEFADGVEALLDFGAVHGGAQEALAEETAAHAGEGLIEHAEDGELGLAAPASAAKMGSSNSRLRTVTASRTMESARS